MSHQSNQIILIWKDVEAQLRRRSLTYGGIPLTGENLFSIRDAYSLWYLCTIDSLISEDISTSRLSTQWLHFVCDTDVRTLAECLKECDSLLLRNVSTSYDDFKHHLRDSYPFIGRILSPIKQIMVRWFDNQSIHSFSLIHSWFCFWSRVNLTLPSLADEAMEKYLNCEKLLQTDGFTVEEEYLISRWFPRQREYAFKQKIMSKHSTGSTADAGRHMVDKYLSYATDTRLNYLHDGQTTPRSCNSPLDRTCRVVCVPKSVLGYRTISMEPSSLMWHQQGCLVALVDYIHSNKELRQRFVPELQEPNRELAWLGSLDGSFATIDLSDASDSVTWPLVQRWFRNTFLYKWMLCTRSTNASLPDGSNVALKKFAPMGSALCFPTESVIFSAITNCAIREGGGDPRQSKYRVYGDDIVVEAEFAESVVDRLQSNGFRVNRSKSFVNSSPDFTFRESCGGEYLNGTDVTPVRLSRRFSGLHLTAHRPSRIEGIIDLANHTLCAYPSVRRRAISALLELPASLRPLFDSDGEKGVFSFNPSNWHLPSPRWSADYQRFYIRHGISSMRLETHDDLTVEDIRLFEYLRQADGRRRLIYPEDRIDVTMRRQTAGIWTVTSSPAEGILPSTEII